MKIAKGNVGAKFHILTGTRVWKVYKQRFSENTELAIGRTLKEYGDFPFIGGNGGSDLP